MKSGRNNDCEKVIGAAHFQWWDKLKFLFTILFILSKITDYSQFSQNLLYLANNRHSDIKIACGCF